MTKRFAPASLAAALLMAGTRESATINAVLVVVKVLALVAFVAIAAPHFDAANGPYIPLTTAVYPKKRAALAALGEVDARVDSRGLHTLTGPGSRRGIILSGMVALSVADVLEGLADRPDVLKLAMPYPMPRRAIGDFLAAHDEVKILEELDDTLEKDIKAMAWDQGLRVRLLGKDDDEDWIGEYTPDKVRDILHRTWPDMIPARIVPAIAESVPPRPAQMCPGCGHRSAFHAVKQALPAGTITVGDIGCHTLGFMEPYRMGEVLLCMGASSGMAAGLRQFNDSRKVVAFLGDSTFFHAGLPGIESFDIALGNEYACKT